jgi:hypothetical protein
MLQNEDWNLNFRTFNGKPQNTHMLDDPEELEALFHGVQLFKENMEGVHCSHRVLFSILTLGTFHAASDGYSGSVHQRGSSCALTCARLCSFARNVVPA